MLTILSAMTSLISFGFGVEPPWNLSCWPSDIRCCSSPTAARSTVASWRRSVAVGLALPNLATLLEGDGSGEARDRSPVAPARLPQILALALKTAGVGRQGVHGEIRDLIRQMSAANPLPGCAAADSRRDAQAGNRSQPGNRREIYDPAAVPSLTDPVDLFAQPDRRYRGDRHVCGRHRRVPVAVRERHSATLGGRFCI